MPAPRCRHSRSPAGMHSAASANPHSASVQPFHVDMGLLPDAKGYSVCNCVWMLDDFTRENGALRVIPGSHNWHRKPQDEMPDPYGNHPQELLVTGRAGTAAFSPVR